MKIRFFDYATALLIIICLNFMLPRLMPGDPLAAIYGEDALAVMTPELEQQLRERLGLDGSLGKQFISYLALLARGDLGYSYYYETNVATLIGEALPWTLLLAGSALLAATALGFALGLESGWRRGRKADKRFLGFFMVLNGFPDFLLAILLLIIFGVTLGLFPLSGALTPYAYLSGPALVVDVLRHLALPLTSLVLAEISACYLLTRNTVINVLGEPFMLTARAKGLAEHRVRYVHAGRNSLLPLLTRTGFRMGRVFGGALFVEIVFAYPGMGLLIYQSLLSRDYPVLQGAFLIIAIGVLFFNMMAEFIYKKIDPRVAS